jgi:hypothetical protein
MGCVDCGGDNNWDNCDALEIEKGTNRLPKKLSGLNLLRVNRGT